MSVHELEVTLPDEPCDPCTLQVIQIMEDASFSDDDFYFQCTDIVIQGVGGGTDGTGSGPGGDSSGSASASATAGDDGGDDGAGTGGTTGPAEGDDGPGDGADDAGDDAADDAGTAGGGSAATDFETAGGSDDDSGGCGCTSSPVQKGGVWMLGLFGVALVRRRR